MRNSFDNFERYLRHEFINDSYQDAAYQTDSSQRNGNIEKFPKNCWFSKFVGRNIKSMRASKEEPL